MISLAVWLLLVVHPGCFAQQPLVGVSAAVPSEFLCDSAAQPPSQETLRAIVGDVTGQITAQFDAINPSAGRPS